MLPLIFLIHCLITSLQAYTNSVATSQTTLPTSFSNHVSPPTAVTVPPFPHRRVFPPVSLENGWRVQLATFESALPVSAATLILGRFYEDIIHQASTPRAPETGLFHFRLGVLTLAFECRQTPVSWYFVRRFAAMMLISTQFVNFSTSTHQFSKANSDFYLVKASLEHTNCSMTTSMALGLWSLCILIFKRKTSRHEHI